MCEVEHIIAVSFFHVAMDSKEVILSKMRFVKKQTSAKKKKCDAA